MAVRKQIGNEICPKCGQLGNSFSKPSNNIHSKNVYLYIWFRHNSKKLKHCRIDNILKSENEGTLESHKEFNYKTLQADTFVVYSNIKSSILEKFPLKEVHVNDALPVVVYSMKKEVVIPDFVGICRICHDKMTHIHDLRCDICDNKLILFCPTCEQHYNYANDVPPVIISNSLDFKDLHKELTKSKIPILTIQNILWYLNRKKRYNKNFQEIEFLESLLSKLESKDENEVIIITYGHDAVRFTDKVIDDERWLIQKITEFIDKYGILEQLHHSIENREKQIDRYNNPAKIL